MKQKLKTLLVSLPIGNVRFGKTKDEFTVEVPHHFSTTEARTLLYRTRNVHRLEVVGIEPEEKGSILTISRKFLKKRRKD